MRTIPVDTTRVSFIGTGKAVAKAVYVEMSDGSRRRAPDQAMNEHGVLLWTVDVLVDDPDALRAEVIGVTVASPEEPVVAKFRPVAFYGVTATIYRDQTSGQPKVSLRAEGIETAAVKPVAAAGS